VKAIAPPAGYTPPPFDRQRFVEMINKLGTAIANGECTPELGELEALVLICEDRQLPIEAARVRRWLGRS